ncbi:Uncharacterised protein g900 [Pycnogonum litorale]
MLTVFVAVWTVSSVCAAPSSLSPSYTNTKSSNGQIVRSNMRYLEMLTNKRADNRHRAIERLRCTLPGYPPDLCELCAKHTGSRKAYTECCRGSSQILEFCVEFLYYKLETNRPGR